MNRGEDSRGNKWLDTDKPSKIAWWRSYCLPESASLQQVSLQTGVSESTLERWLSEALAQPSKTQEWTPAARFDALLITAAMDEQSKNEWCRSHGVYPQELEQWKLQAQQGLSGDGQPHCKTPASKTAN